MAAFGVELLSIEDESILTPQPGSIRHDEDWNRAVACDGSGADKFTNKWETEQFKNKNGKWT